jgi:addiction module RelE/StbE family toxin
MDFKISPDLIKELRQIKRKNKPLALKIEKQLILFQENHLHRSLRVHKLIGKFDNIWSVSIDRKYRMLYFLEDNEAYFFDFGTHDQVYRR